MRSYHWRVRGVLLALRPVITVLFIIGVCGNLLRAQSRPDSLAALSTIYIDKNGDDRPDHLNETITITGIANISSGLLHESYLQAFVQNDSVGASIFAEDISIPFQQGDSLVVTGQIQLYNGLKELQVDSYKIVFKNVKVPDPKPLEQVVQNPAEYIGMLAEGDGKIVGKGSVYNGKYLNLALSDSGSEIKVYVSNFHRLFEDFDFDVLNIGDNISVTGILSEYNPDFPEEQSYQLHLRTPEDLEYAGIPGYLFVVAGVLIVISLLVAGWIISLRRQVSKKTATIQKSLDEKEILLKEIHHRVKNNLSIISGLIGLQLDSTNDEEAQRVLEDSQSRIQSMALIHDKLYQTESISEIRLDNYIRELVESIHRTFTEQQDSVDLRFDLEDITADIDKVIPCGLLINELVVNSFKHAFSKGKDGTLLVNLKRVNGQVELTIADNGPGLPEDFELSESDSLGSMLIETFARQLEAETEIENNSGSTFRFRFSQN